MITTKNLKRLLAEFARLDGERVRHEQMAISLQAEENKLMDTVNLEDKAEFEKVSQLRLRRDIVPRKIKSYEQAAADIKAKLAGDCSKTTMALLDIIRAKREALTVKIAKALEPFFPTEGAAATAAQHIVNDTTNGEVLSNRESRLNNDNFENRETLTKANELLEIAPVVEGVEI